MINKYDSVFKKASFHKVAGQRHARKSCGKRSRSATSRPMKRLEVRSVLEAAVVQEEPEEEFSEIASIV